LFYLPGVDVYAIWRTVTRPRCECRPAALNMKAKKGFCRMLRMVAAESQFEKIIKRKLLSQKVKIFHCKKRCEIKAVLFYLNLMPA